MRALWSGDVAFGLVSVPVKLYSATRDHDVSLHQVHDADGGRIRYERRCEVCEKTIDYEDIDKAYADGEDTIVLRDEEIEALPADREHEIEVVQFVPDDQIDPLSLEKSYFLEPASRSPKAYVLLRRTLESTSRTAVVQFALRSKTRLGVLRVRGNTIVLQAMRWADEVREADFEATKKPPRISAKELEMAEALVEQYSEDFEPEKYVDEYQEQLRTLIEEKIEKGEALDTEATFGSPDEDEEDGGNVVDLMEALKRSVDSRRGNGSGNTKSAGTSSARKAGGSTSSTKKSGGKASATKKSDAKKSDAKKSAASKKKTSGKSGTRGDSAGKKPQKRERKAS